MRWREEFLTEVGEKLVQLGLKQCSICGAERLETSRHPVILPWAGSPWIKKGHRAFDPEANVLFMVLVECSMCGNSLLFHSARFRTGDEPTIERGSDPPYVYE